mmetsp:Transcript_107975/g.304210  ORF Transcript_107975/g.304210 Transcript_107975/m.304210 type:complete len:238 (-) Transcript_107975:281-994(-)
MLEVGLLVRVILDRRHVNRSWDHGHFAVRQRSDRHGGRHVCIEETHLAEGHAGFEEREHLAVFFRGDVSARQRIQRGFVFLTILHNNRLPGQKGYLLNAIGQLLQERGCRPAEQTIEKGLGDHAVLLRQRTRVYPRPCLWVLLHHPLKILARETGDQRQRRRDANRRVRHGCTDHALPADDPPGSNFTDDTYSTLLHPPRARNEHDEAAVNVALFDDRVAASSDPLLKHVDQLVHHL